MNQVPDENLEPIEVDEDDDEDFDEADLPTQDADVPDGQAEIGGGK